jgi:hypothetical protein
MQPPLGRGAFGYVYEARSAAEPGASFALKLAPLKGVGASKLKKSAQSREAALLFKEYNLYTGARWTGPQSDLGCIKSARACTYGCSLPLRARCTLSAVHFRNPTCRHIARLPKNAYGEDGTHRWLVMQVGCQPRLSGVPTTVGDGPPRASVTEYLLSTWRLLGHPLCCSAWAARCPRCWSAPAAAAVCRGPPSPTSPVRRWTR